MSNFKLNISQIITGLVVGIIVGGFGAYFALYKEIVQLKANVEMLRTTNQMSSQSSNNQNSSNSGILTSDSNTVNVPDISPEKIIDVIKEQQAIFVKESYGENAYQCFTDNDLQNYMAKGVPNTVRANLQKSNEYLTLVIALKNMDPVKRQQLFLRAQNTFKLTWAELGRISREGQTDAGQTAEKLIAKSVVDLTKDLLSKSKEEIKSMMQ